MILQLAKTFPLAVEGTQLPLNQTGGEMNLDNIFKHHTPNENQLQRIDLLRWKAKEFADAVVSATVGSADQSTAIRKIREALMTANAAVVLEGLV